MKRSKRLKVIETDPRTEEQKQADDEIREQYEGKYRKLSKEEVQQGIEGGKFPECSLEVETLTEEGKKSLATKYVDIESMIQLTNTYGLDCWKEVKETREALGLTIVNYPTRTGFLLKCLRRRLGLTMRQAAEIVGCGAPRIAYLESYQSNPSVRTIDEYLEKFGYEMEIRFVEKGKLHKDRIISK